MKNDQDAANEDFVSPSILMDKDGQRLAIVKAEFSTKRRFGGFRLPSSANVDQILATAASLQTSDGRRFQLLNLRHCTAFHSIDPDMPHLEFEW